MSSKTPLYSSWLSDHLALSRYSINVYWLTDEWMNEFQSPEGITWEALSESVSYTTSFLAAGNETDGKPLKFWGCLSLREPSGQPAMGRTVVAQVFHSCCRFFFHTSHKYPSTSWVRQLPKWTHTLPSQNLVMDVAIHLLSWRLHKLQHIRLPCPSLSPKVCSHSCPLSWCIETNNHIKGWAKSSDGKECRSVTETPVKSTLRRSRKASWRRCPGHRPGCEPS